MSKQNIQQTIDNWSNSFLRPHIPPKLMSHSVIKNIKDDGAKLIYAKFLFGEQNGIFKKIPFNGSYGNIMKDMKNESLWSYALPNESIPSGFETKSYERGIIRTGQVNKCRTCKGQGTVTCKKCKGKVRWTVKRGDRYVEKICSCGNGRQNCEDCTGYGEVETVIGRKTKYRLFEARSSQYNGVVPVKKINKISGITIFEHIIDYPLNVLMDMLAGGIDVHEFGKLNSAVLDDIHYRINSELFDKDIDTRQIHDLINTLFTSVPNPCNENRLLEKEVMPIRVMLRVEDAPVTQVDYSWQDKDFTLWIYGNENRVWYKSAPFSINYKIITLIIFLLGIILFFVYYHTAQPLVVQ